MFTWISVHPAAASRLAGDAVVIEIRKVGVAGAGTMGHGIAQVFAQSGYQVLFADQTRELALAGLARIKKNLNRAVERGKLTQKECEEFVGRISVKDNIADLRESHLVVEAAAESLELKGKLFDALDKILPKETILASNTSSLPITKLASFTGRPSRFVGMHFMNPVPVMKLVEIVRGYLTDDETVQTVRDLCVKLGKTPVEANDFPGFISNRILMPMINEAIFAYMEGVGSKEAIDTVMRLGMNHPMGPLELADFIGLDVCLSILEVMHQEFGDPKYRPSPLLRKMVQAGTLGKKTGKGFYSY